MKVSVEYGENSTKDFSTISKHLLSPEMKKLLFKTNILNALKSVDVVLTDDNSRKNMTSLILDNKVAMESLDQVSEVIITDHRPEVKEQLAKILSTNLVVVTFTSNIEETVNVVREIYDAILEVIKNF